MKQQQLLTLGALLRDRRVELRVTPRQLASAAGIHRSTLVRIEHGQVGNLSLDLLSRLAELLGCSLVDVFLQIGYFHGSDLPTMDTYIKTKYAGLPTRGISELLTSLSRLQKLSGFAAERPQPLIKKMLSPTTPEDVVADPSFRSSMEAASGSKPTHHPKTSPEAANDHFGDTT